MRASNRRAVEALVGGKVDWMDAEEVARLEEAMEEITMRLDESNELWHFAKRSPEPLTIELLRRDNLLLSVLVVPTASTITRHYPPGCFLMLKCVGHDDARGTVRSLIHSRAAGMTSEVSKRVLEPRRKPWVFYGGPMREFTTDPSSTETLCLVEVLISPPGRPVTLSPNHTSTVVLEPEVRQNRLVGNGDGQGEGCEHKKSFDAERFFAKDPDIPDSVKSEAHLDPKKIMSRVGGMSAVIANITRRILASRKVSLEKARELGLEHVRGLLLYGPPGVGKTLLAREIARELKASSVRVVSGPEMLSKFVGDAEKTVRGLFHQAEVEQRVKGDESGLHVVIMDELDSVFKVRGTIDDGGVRDSVCNQLLAKMDGVSQLKNILVIGLTNRRELIDPALLRPGRFEVQIRVPLPSTADRQEIIEIHLSPLMKQNCVDEGLRCLVSSKELAERTEGYSGADLAGLIRSAVSFAMQRAIDSNTEIEGVTVTSTDIELALKEMNQHIDTISNDRRWLRLFRRNN